MVKFNSCLRMLGSALLTMAICFGFNAAADSGSTRTIHLRQSDAQTRFESKIYQLKNANATDIAPFVSSAILRYDKNSTISCVTSDKGNGNALLVSTGKNFMPYVDKIIEVLDRKPAKKTECGSTISGTGLTRVAYSPRYRAAAELARVINATITSGTGAAFINEETNTIYWRDQDAAAKRTLAWLEKLDQPVPQVRVRVNYYELRDSDLKDWGFDYLAWKNGPGVNLFNVGYNAGEMVINEVLEQVPYIATNSWGLGGFFTAPQFDMSFIRCLEQAGSASSVATGSLMMINTPVGNKDELALLRKVQAEKPETAPFMYKVSMTPEYQTINKNVLGRTLVGKSYYEDENGEKHADPPQLQMQVVNPFICYDKVPGRKSNGKDGGVIFDWSLYFKSVVERGNTGAELSNSALFSGATTLAFGKEKILAIYEKENDVEQTIGLPILCRIPVIKYLFSTVTSIKERTYIVVSAEATLVDIKADKEAFNNDSAAVNVKRRIEDPFRCEEDAQKPAEKKQK
ncbi:MAG: hypothetical protein IKD29_08375 [Lentisphaeria bacterium]|nr:hypothetical protein [Lentisphaerota bacterium]MBR2633449.1 hypothetical protein [Lentisphaeria bacterium]